MDAIFVVPMPLGELLQSVRVALAGKHEVDDCGVSYWNNFELAPDEELVEDMPMSSTCLAYGRHHRTLPALHGHIEPVAGIVWSYNNYSGGRAKLRVVNLSMLKGLLSTGDYASVGSGFEYEVLLACNGKAYTKDLLRGTRQAFEEATGCVLAAD